MDQVVGGTKMGVHGETKHLKIGFCPVTIWLGGVMNSVTLTTWSVGGGGGGWGWGVTLFYMCDWL